MKIGALTKRVLEVSLLVCLGLGIGYLMMGYPPEPPPGTCDSDGTAKECSEWWLELMERQ